MKRKPKTGAAPPRILNAETVVVPIESVQPHPRNVNEGDVGAIHGSITENGFWGSILVQRSTGFIVKGNHSWEAARRAGLTEVPVTYLDIEDDLALRILLADNRTARLGSDNIADLAELLQEIRADAGTLLGTAYTDADLDDLLRQLSTDDPNGGGDEDEPNLDPGDGRYQEQFGVIVVCSSEQEQQRVYDHLTAQGLDCKVVNT